ncbi:hypothetical protein SAMN05444411_102517 [Lutibacter oricola]|uniref:VWA domain-containing protein n=1 Tax=Lutibacter oricola TaxID=762486 RepID=A0A1H2XMS0_9FLAO|nr:VWA domain-containing protein [Lutibacter oricola]SDW94137.1 hypothetical protein SAMN05444411_102517 [Lutibacter oricola]
MYNVLYIVLIAVIALLLAFFQYLYKNRKTTSNVFLFLLRFSTLFLVFLLLFNPSIKKQKIETIKPNLSISVDQSKSIKHLKQESNVRSFVELLKANKQLNEKFNVRYYSFGSNFKELDSLSFSENQTNLFKPINEFSKLYKKQNNPVLLITDGNQTIGNSIEFSNYKSPVYALVVGDTTKLQDIYIHQINANKQTYINNKVQVELFINYEGNKDVSKKLTISYKGKNIFSKTLHFSKENNVHIESLFVTASEKGNQYYNARIETLENEKNTSNNSKSFSINVIEEKMKILLLSSIVHPDLGMFKKSIESNKQREVVIKNIKEFKEDLSNYQLVILNQPTKEFETVFNSIKSKELNYFVITGLQTDWEFLNKIQSNFYKEAISKSELYKANFNKDYSSFLNTDIGFSKFSPIEDKFGKIIVNTKVNTIAFQKIGSFETKNPLLATIEGTRNRVGVLFGENSWRWRMQSFLENKSFQPFDDFMSSLILYMSSNKRNNRLQVNLSSIYYANEVLKISSIYLDENLNFDPRAKLWLQIDNKELKSSEKTPFSLQNNSFKAELENLKPGEYSYTVSVENQSIKKYGSFKVEPFEIEQQKENANDKALKYLAHNTKGSVFYNTQEQLVIDTLLKNEDFKSIQKSSIEKTPLINWKWLLVLIVLLLSVEWFARKYYGKI